MWWRKHVYPLTMDLKGQNSYWHQTTFTHVVHSVLPWNLGLVGLSLEHECLTVWLWCLRLLARACTGVQQVRVYRNTQHCGQRAIRALANFTRETTVNSTQMEKLCCVCILVRVCMCGCVRVRNIWSRSVEFPV